MHKLDELLRSLAQGNDAARLAAAEWLAQHPDPQAATALVAALADENDEVRQWAGEALESLGPPPKSQLGELTRLAGSDNDDVAYWAITLIGRLREDAAPAAAGLTPIMEKHHSPVVRRRAEWALEQIVLKGR